jgi:hypothetical protein
MRTARISFFLHGLLVALLICFVLAGPRATAAVTALSGHSVYIAQVSLHRDQAHWSTDAAPTAAFGAAVYYRVVRRFARPPASPFSFSPASAATGRAPPGAVAQAG